MMISRFKRAKYIEEKFKSKSILGYSTPQIMLNITDKITRQQG
jgi:hypothetical protein